MLVREEEEIHFSLLFFLNEGGKYLSMPFFKKKNKGIGNVFLPLIEKPFYHFQ